MNARVALLARCDHRGIASQTQDLYRWLDPWKTLTIRMGRRWTSTDEFPELYPGARVADFDGLTGRLPDAALDWLLDGTDLVLSVETPHDFRIHDLARQRDIASAVVANPEFYRHVLEPTLPTPSLVIAPTTWRLGQMPGAVFVPQPVDRERFPFTRRGTGPVRFVHVVGRAAFHDRAGTDLVLASLRFLREPVDLTIRTQGPLTATQRLAVQGLPPARRPKVETGDLPDPAALYREADVLVAPRRYGGNHLPFLEARSCGLAVITADREPERGWLSRECLVRADHRRSARFQGGVMPLDDADPRGLAEAIERLRDTPGLVEQLSAGSDAWAAQNSWETLLGRWEEVLEAAVPSLAVTR